MFKEANRKSEKLFPLQKWQKNSVVYPFNLSKKGRKKLNEIGIINVDSPLEHIDKGKMFYLSEL